MSEDAENGSEVSKDLRRRLVIRRIGRAEAIYLCAWVAFSVLAVWAHGTNFFGWDLSIERAIQAHASPALTIFFTAISLPGNLGTPYVLTTVFVVIFWLSGLRSEAAGLLLSASGAGVLNRLFKYLVARPRPISNLVQVLPADRNGMSFPSGHVAFYVCFFGFLFFVAYSLLPRGSWLRRLAMFITAFLVITVAFSRVYLGAHWPSDTLGAYLWSIIWLAFALHLYRVWKTNNTFHPARRAAASKIDRV